MNFEAPLTSLVWLTSIVSVVLTYVLSYLLIPTLGGNTDLWWQLSTVITCGTLAGAIIPEFVKVFTSTHSRARARSGHLVARRRRVAQHPVGPRRRQLQRLLARPHDHGPDVDRLPACRAVGRSAALMAGAGDLRVRPGRVRLPRHGPGDDRRRLVRPGHRQRAVGLRAVADRDASRTSSRRSQQQFGFTVELRRRQGTARGERRRRQHLQGDGQAGADRHRGRRRDDDDLLDHHGADAGARRSRRWTSCRSCTRRSCSA